MRCSILGCIVLAVGVSRADAQSTPSAAGLAAEGQARWTAALELYRAQVAEDPRAAAVWTRIADIETTLGQPERSLAARERAAAAAPSDAEVVTRLSQAYAALDRAVPALRAIEVALALEPASDAHLRAHATLATWAGEYRAAASSYRKLRHAHPNEHELTLALARVTVWAGQTDAAVAAYRAYLSTPGAASEVMIELARAESWRGNYGAAISVLDTFERRFGKTEASARERVSVLARGGRPRQALRNVQVLHPGSPQDVELELSRTIALAALQHYGAAVSTLESTESIQPGDRSTRAASSLVKSLLGSSAGPSTTFYSDSDGLRATKVTPRFDVAFKTDTRFHGGYEHLDLQARAGTGLEQTSGSTTASVDHVWAGVTQRLGPVTVGGTLGDARPETRRVTTSSAFLKLAPADAFTISVERGSSFAAISPRMAGLGLTALTDRAQIDWTPGVRYGVVTEASYEQLSDGNRRWNMSLSPRAAILRTQHLNLDLGLILRQFGARQNLDNGYYDPRRYEYYSVVLSPYWKASENIGIGGSFGIGGQREAAAREFRPGGDASVEATFGIYRQWLLKAYGAATNNQRLDSGAFRGTSGGVTLLRRF
jgi:tetratricopeptide (TPR) repeat protein